MSGLKHKQILLTKIYEAFDDYLQSNYQTVCRQGCALCCTQQVTLTSLEGYQIIEGLKQAGTELHWIENLSVDGSFFQPQYTINDLAYACLNHKAPPEETPGATVRPCPLLENDLCTVYESRPFACRAFLSLVDCQSTGQAEVPTSLASIIGACEQIIEHIDVGGCFGNLTDMLVRLYAGEKTALYSRNMPMNTNIMPETKPIPGFLIPPEDAGEVSAFLSRLFNAKAQDEIFYRILTALRPMPKNN